MCTHLLYAACTPIRQRVAINAALSIVKPGHVGVGAGHLVSDGDGRPIRLLCDTHRKLNVGIIHRPLHPHLAASKHCGGWAQGHGGILGAGRGYAEACDKGEKCPVSHHVLRRSVHSSRTRVTFWQQGSPYESVLARSEAQIT
eukprot:1192647-Prorocentrum_minimum.AAC.6